MKSALNRTFLLIGASSGIGYATARLLANRGDQIITVSRRALPSDLPGKTFHYLLDGIKDPDALKKLPLTDSLDGLVYFPGTITLKPFNRLTVDDFLNDFQVNVLGAVRVLQAALPALKKSEAASVVLFSSVATKAGMRFHASIAAAKAAVEGLTKSLAAEYAGSQIRFNAIAPSITDTPLAERLLNNESKRANLAVMHPLRGIGRVEQIAQLVAYLLSPESGWMTGQIFAYDGGLSTIKNS